MKKSLLFSGIAFIIAGGFVFSILPIQFASFIEEDISSQWQTALRDSDTGFFEANIITNPENTEKQELLSILSAHPLRSDVNIIQHANELFFSFLGIRENSDVLVPFYGVYNLQTKEIDTQFVVSFSLLKQENNEVYLVNESPYSIPLQGKYISLPEEKILSTNEKRVDSGSFVVFNSEQGELPNRMFRIESLDLGYIGVIR